MKTKIRVQLPPPKMERPYTFDELYEEYYKRINMSLKALLRNLGGWSEDLTQETFLKLIRFIEITPGGIDYRRAGGLLTHLTQQSYAQFMRKRGEEDMRKYDEDPDELFDLEVPSLLVDCLDPSEIYLRSERYQDMFKRIDKLPKDEIKLLQLVHWERKSLKEAAAMLDITFTNAATRMNRIRNKLGKFTKGDKDEHLQEIQRRS